jgi:crotonobetainyl-CoA:carnitine CoA-transferase CaiB-like acyl-CoA transferase
MPASTLLHDIKIVDLTTVIFGPYCTQTLADMGADVVKVEPPVGDDFRGVGKPQVTRGMGACHLTINRGKRSVTWDMKTPQGYEAITRLIATSDVFIHNLRDDAIARLGLTFEAVSAIKPDIVYVHCTGFGSTGPYSGLPAYDDIIQGLSGMTTLLPRVLGDGQPRFIPMTIADKVSGLHAVYATLAALRHRDNTGIGVKVEVPMFEVVTHFVLQEHLCAHTFVPPNGDVGYGRQLDPSRQPLQTQDGWITMAPYVDKRWVRFFTDAGHANVLEIESLSTPGARYKNAPLLMEAARPIIATQTTAYWLSFLDKADIPAGRVNDLAELTQDPHLQAVNFFVQRTHPSEGEYLEIQPPITFHGVGEKPIRSAPLLGEHNETVLRELGL